MEEENDVKVDCMKEEKKEGENGRWKCLALQKESSFIYFIYLF